MPEEERVEIVYGVDEDGAPEQEPMEENVAEVVDLQVEREIEGEVELARAILEGQEEIDELYFTPPSSLATIVTQSQLTLEDLLWDLDLEGTEATPGSAEEALLFSNMEYLRDLPSPSPSEEEWLLK